MLPSIKDLFFVDKKVVGIDIGSHSIKLVEISGTPKEYVLDSFGQIPLEKGIVEDGIVKNRNDLTKNLKELFKASKCQLRKVAAALPGHIVVIKKTALNQMDDHELRELIMDEASEYLPFSHSSQIHFDCHIVGSNALNPEKMDVVIAAARRDLIKNYTEAIEKMGCRVAIMDVDSFALQTAFEENYEVDDADIVVLLNIGASITNINIVRGGESLFTRNVLVGGATITQALSNQRGIPFEEAEIIKCEEIDDSFRTELLDLGEPIFLEIERTLDFFISEMGGMDVNRIVVSGGCSRIPGIVEHLTSRLRCDTGKLNPFKKITYDKKVFNEAYIETISPIAALGVGLALRRIDDI